MLRGLPHTHWGKGKILRTLSCLCYSAAAAAKIRQKKARKKKGQVLRNSRHFRTPYNLPFLCPSVGTLGCGERKYWTTVKGQKKKGTGTTSTGGRGYSRGGRHGLFFFFFFLRRAPSAFFLVKILRYSNYTEGEMIDCRLFEFSLLGGRHSG